MYGLLGGYDNMWLRETIIWSSGIWRYILDILDIFMVGNLQNILMEHDICLTS